MTRPKAQTTDPQFFGLEFASYRDKTTAIERSKQRKWLGGQDSQGDLVHTDLAHSHLTISKRSIGEIKRTGKKELI